MTLTEHFLMAGAATAAAAGSLSAPAIAQAARRRTLQLHAAGEFGQPGPHLDHRDGI